MLTPLLLPTTSSVKATASTMLADLLAIASAKLSATAIRALGVGLGSNLPGKVARAISPGLLSRLTGKSRQGVVAVSGTNGKSTTAGLIYSIMRSAGWKTVHNRQGANLITGITASAVEAAGLHADLDADLCLFEIDEAALPVVAEEVEISFVLVTNLFRDQLDRYGELDTTGKLIERGILCRNSSAILNADDPNVSRLAPSAPRLYFGIESVSASARNTARARLAEASACPGCGVQYEYSLVFYGQLGHYGCPGCRRFRPVPAICAQNVHLSGHASRFTLCLGEERIDITLNLPGLFNVYNAIGAAAAAYKLGITAATIAAGLAGYTTLFGRSEKLEIQGKPVLIQLIKNPAGASQVVAAAASAPKARILIAINDNLADGRDVSWLWDADFEELTSHGSQITVSGKRAQDMAVRLKYAGLPVGNILVAPLLAGALDSTLADLQDGETLWILPTYTCLLELQKILKRRGYSLAGT